MMQLSSIHETINAKWLTPEEVAKTFVPNDQRLPDLFRKMPSIVVGPRGSGKTTLLKMLQLPALVAWEHEKADKYRKMVDFFSFFVPVDNTWSEQLEGLVASGKHKNAYRQFMLCAFSNHCTIKLVEAMQDIVDISALAKERLGIDVTKFNREKEVEFVKRIAEYFDVSVRANTIYDLYGAFMRMQSDLFGLAAEVTDGSVQTQVLPRWARPYILENISYVSGLFNELSGNRRRKWAFMVDELEISPLEVRDFLFSTIRGGKDGVFYKLSISPSSSYFSIVGHDGLAQERQDHNVISLFYKDRSELYQFTEDLAVSVAKNNGLLVSSLPELLGDSFAVDLEEERVKQEADSGGKRQLDDIPLSDFSRQGRLGRHYWGLLAKDDSFAAYLKSRGIELQKAGRSPSKDLAPTLRRMSAVVPVRNFFLDYHSKGRSRLRRFKRMSIYAGARSVAAIFEGNPRWIIAYMTDMLKENPEGKLPIPPAVQAKTIDSAASDFRARLRIMPYKPPVGVKSSRGLLSFVGFVGDALKRRFLHNSFDQAAGAAFTVDSHFDSAETIAAIEDCLNVGAFIYCPEGKENRRPSSVKGKRLRLSYMLSVGYQLPLSIGSGPSLHKLLDEAYQSPLLSEGDADDLNI